MDSDRNCKGSGTVAKDFLKRGMPRLPTGECATCARRWGVSGEGRLEVHPAGGVREFREDACP